MSVHLWRLVVTLLAMVALLVNTAAAGHSATVEPVQLADGGPLAEPAETGGDVQDECEPTPPPSDPVCRWATAAPAPRNERPQDIDPSNDRPPPRA